MCLTGPYRRDTVGRVDMTVTKVRQEKSIMMAMTMDKVVLATKVMATATLMVGKGTPTTRMTVIKLTTLTYSLEEDNCSDPNY
jgi:hypothetical protein